MPYRSFPSGPRRRRPRPHEVLGLSSREHDAVKVIEVAQTLLAQWRRIPLDGSSGQSGPTGEARSRILQIIAAREAMLKRIHARSLGR